MCYFIAYRRIFSASQKTFFIPKCRFRFNCYTHGHGSEVRGRVRLNQLERRNAIMNTLRRDGRTTVASLARTFDVSERTIYTDITALSTGYPIRTVRGRYGGGVELANWFHPNANTLSPQQEELLRRLRPTLTGNDLVVLNSILVQFSLSHGC